MRGQNGFKSTLSQCHPACSLRGQKWEKDGRDRPFTGLECKDRAEISMLLMFCVCMCITLKPLL